MSVAVILSAPGAGATPAQFGHGVAPVPAPVPGRTPDEALHDAASAFVLNWVDGEGRVVRRDQGNDTVSEGQAYGMLVAVAVGDEPRFQKIWTWTREHLQRADGLLAWHWANGAVVDPTPASDADLDAARALVRAGALFERPDLTADGNQLAGRIMDQLTLTTLHGRILLPGPWANQEAGISYNPSYPSPAAFAILGRSTGDPRWQELATGTTAVTAALLTAGTLPPDWALIRTDGSVQPVRAPGGRGPGKYSYDAARVPVRLAESCSPADLTAAANTAPALRISGMAAPLDLPGATAAGVAHPIFRVAMAAALAAAGHHAEARSDLEWAETLNNAHPTYYGTAWIALGRIYLDSPVLGGCPALPH
ncbi:MAG: glycoside hydrolase [Spirosoma sp.]|nr:glycoside hydrolase [Spirosoma sp.]